MKKSIIIICAVLAALSLTAFGYINWSQAESQHEKTSGNKAAVLDTDFINTFLDVTKPDLVYNVSSRFITTVTKEKLTKAKSIVDILPEEVTQSIASYQSVKVAILYDDGEISEMGDNDVLTSAQIELLQSIDYSTNIYIKANYKTKYALTGALYDEYISYYMTIVPEKEAQFTNGPEALIDYLKKSSKEITATINRDQLKPGKVNFTVTRQGTIVDVKLSSTSGYPTVDQALIEIITAMPGSWDPATNSKGEKVDQEFVFFFGMQGC